MSRDESRVPPGTTRKPFFRRDEIAPLLLVLPALLGLLAGYVYVFLRLSGRHRILALLICVVGGAYAYGLGKRGPWRPVDGRQRWPLSPTAAFAVASVILGGGVGGQEGRRPRPLQWWWLVASLLLVVVMLWLAG